jgi:putative transposase
MTGEMLADLEEILQGVLSKWDCYLVEFGGESDHVHLLIDYHPSLNLSDLVKNLKSVSSRQIRLRYPGELQKARLYKAFWNRAYALISVGGRANIETLLKYIENQDTPGSVNR